MATFSKKMMGKEVGDAKVYAKPHTMSGKEVKASSNPGSGPDHSRASTVNMSVGNITFCSRGDRLARDIGNNREYPAGNCQPAG